MNIAASVTINNISLAPDNNEERTFLEAIKDPEKRNEVITILKHAGLIP